MTTTETVTPEPFGQIIAFYSYKGGTGRTMAVANVGCVLAETAVKPVLLVDWDLEAPGLHSFFSGRIRSDWHRDHDAGLAPGLIDLFVELDRKTRFRKKSRGTLDEESVDGILSQVKPEKFCLETDVSNLHLLKAGRFDEAYPQVVNHFGWERLYMRAPTLFRQLGDRLAKTYSYVLIDSRTGLSDTSGICTSLMPERLVLVFTPNTQSTAGAIEVGERATKYRKASEDLRPLSVFPLPSRIEGTEHDLQKAWRYGREGGQPSGYQPLFERFFESAYGLSECSLEAYFNEVQVQHVSFYAFGEEIAVLRDKTSERLSLARSYLTFTDKLVQLDGPWDAEDQIGDDGAEEDDLGVPALTGASGRTVDKLELATSLRDPEQLVTLRRIVRRTRKYFRNQWPEFMTRLAEGGKEREVQENEIYDVCLSYVRQFEQDVRPIEEFGIALADADHDEGLRALFPLLDDWVALSFPNETRVRHRPIRGSPQVMALRVLLNLGAKAVDNLSSRTIEVVLLAALPVEESSHVSQSTLIDDAHVYHSEAFLGRGDLTVRYIHEASRDASGIRKLFASQSDYSGGLATLLFIASILYSARHPDEADPIYPGFKLIEGSRQLITRALTRIASRPDFVSKLAAMANETVADFRSRWGERVKRLNEAELGSNYWPRGLWEINVEL